MAFYEQKNIEIACDSTTNVTFTRNGKHIDTPHYLKINSLIFPSVSEIDNGLYTCYGTANQLPFQATSELLIGGKVVNLLEWNGW